MESPFLGLDREVGSRAVDVDERDEQDAHRNIRPTDHSHGKLRKICIFTGTTRAASATRGGRGSDGLIDRVNRLANDVPCRGFQ